MAEFEALIVKIYRDKSIESDHYLNFSLHMDEFVYANIRDNGLCVEFVFNLNRIREKRFKNHFDENMKSRNRGYAIAHNEAKRFLREKSLESIL